MLLNRKNIICPISGALAGASSEHANPVGASVVGMGVSHVNQNRMV